MPKRAASTTRGAGARTDSLELWLIDAFTDCAFAGNPAGVCLLEGNRPAEWMQQVAREMNQAETAFLERRDDGFGLRWFTPTVEMDLCGHATLASAHFLWQRKLLSARSAARFHTRSGLLTATRDGDWIVMDFPAMPAKPVDPPPYLLDAVKAPGAAVLFNGTDYLVVQPAAARLRGLTPDYRLLSAVESRGVIVTSPSDTEGVDFLSRFFAPRAGVDEDPVTGSAHCALGPYWGARLGKTDLIGVQVSPRGGMVKVGLAGDRLRLAGRAVTVLKGALSQ